jgi:hypothetical protein
VQRVKQNDSEWHPDCLSRDGDSVVKQQNQTGELEMKQRILRTWVVGLIGLAVPTIGMAQGEVFGPQEGEWEMTLGGSGSNNKDFDSGGFGASGSIGYFFTDDWEVALRQGVSYSDVSGSTTWNAATRAAVDYHFDLNRLRPFVGVNFGGLYGKSVTDSWAAGLEGGLKYYVKPKTFIFAMGEYQWLFKDADRADNNFDEGQFVYSIGLGFNF